MAGLGRGLSSLLSESKKYKEEKIAESSLQENLRTDKEAENCSIVDINIDSLEPSIYQPRKSFDKDNIKELADSILEHGLLEPLLVKKSENGKYAIICGERRFRACKLAGLKKVPCIVRDDLKQKAYAVALIENIQREDLNPLELSQALEFMLNECHLNQDELAKTLGKSRSSVANLLRLKNLNEEVKTLLIQGDIDLGHAKVLLSLDDENQKKAAIVVVKKSLSVRQTEQYVNALKNNSEDAEEKNTYKDPEFTNWEKTLSSRLNGVKVKFSGKGEDKGKLTLSYSSKEQLLEVLKQLGL